MASNAPLRIASRAPVSTVCATHAGATFVSRQRRSSNRAARFPSRRPAQDANSRHAAFLTPLAFRRRRWRDFSTKAGMQIRRTFEIFQPNFQRPVKVDIDGRPRVRQQDQTWAASGPTISITRPAMWPEAVLTSARFEFEAIATKKSPSTPLAYHLNHGRREQAFSANGVRSAAACPRITLGAKNARPQRLTSRSTTAGEAPYRIRRLRRISHLFFSGRRPCVAIRAPADAQPSPPLNGAYRTPPPPLESCLTLLAGDVEVATTLARPLSCKNNQHVRCRRRA